MKPALRLIEGGQVRSVAVKARPLKLSRDLSAGEAFRTVLLECLAHALANMPGVVQGWNEEALHQLRIALRRLDAALLAYARVSDSPDIEELRPRLKAVLNATSPARDLDVFLRLLPTIEAGNIARKEMMAFHAHAEIARKKAWDHAAAYVKSISFTVLLDDIALLAETGAMNSSRKSIRAAARRTLDASLRKCLKRGRKFSSHTARQRHGLRIRLKRLKYESDFFAALKAPHKAKRYRRILRRLQTLLGAQQDLVVARRTLRRLAPHGTHDAAARIVRRYCRSESACLGKATEPVWKKFKTTKPFWL